LQKSPTKIELFCKRALFCQKGRAKYGAHNECRRIEVYTSMSLYASLQLTVIHCNILHTLMMSCTEAHTTTHCNTLQCTATHCNTLQHAAMHCNALHRVRSLDAQRPLWADTDYSLPNLLGRFGTRGLFWQRIPIFVGPFYRSNLAIWGVF